MRFWRKRTDGFDWHAYVRTTVHLRREQRRARLDQIGRAAAEQAKAVAGQAKVAAGSVVQGVANGVALTAGTGWRATATAWRNTIAQPAIALPVVLIGGMALLSGLYRGFTVGLDHEAALPLAIGAVLAGLAVPLAMARLGVSGWRWRRGISAPWVAKVVPAVIPVAIVAGAALALGWFAWGRVLPGQTGAMPQSLIAMKAQGNTVLEGRAVALSGEMIRLQGHLLHLAGIEAPDRQQTCLRAKNQAWRCGEAALAALEHLAHSRTFRCITQGAPDATGRTDANCTVDGRDVGAELVRNGAVFSAATYFGGYAALENEARRSGSGLWAGDAERPADYRAKLWADAQANAPDGCPIKGLITGGRKSYLMPWARAYPSANVRTGRGERWFCSDTEAMAAGFKPVPPGKAVAR